MHGNTWEHPQWYDESTQDSVSRARQRREQTPAPETRKHHGRHKHRHGDDADQAQAGVVKGDWVAFNHWQHGNFAHFLIDHLPLIAQLRAVVPPTTGFLLRGYNRRRQEASFNQAILNTLDPDFAATRIHWIQRNEPISR